MTKILRHPDYKKQCDVAFWHSNIIKPTPIAKAISHKEIPIIDAGRLLYATG